MGLSLTYREAALRKAITQIGVKETPAGSNRGPEVEKYLAAAGLGGGYPWCQAFVNWCYQEVGYDLKHSNEASVGFFEAYARDRGMIAYPPARGDLVCYRFDADNWPDHVGFVERVDGSTIETVEGNTAVRNDANGGMVMRRTRSTARCTFVRIPGLMPVSISEEVNPVEKLNQILDHFEWSIVNKKSTSRPASLPTQIPESWWTVEARLHSLVKRYGAHQHFLGWITARLLGHPKPDYTPAKVPPRWWDGGTEVHKAMNEYSAQRIAPLAAQIDRLQTDLLNVGAGEQERLAKLRELLEEALLLAEAG